MKATIENITNTIQLKEGSEMVIRFLLLLYFNQKQSTKYYAQQLELPKVIVIAMKNELKKAKIIDALELKLTRQATIFIEHYYHLDTLNKDIYNTIQTLEEPDYFKEELELLTIIKNNAPIVDTSLDQSHCNALTSIKRALLYIQNRYIFNHEILCLGDDDYVSVALALLIKKMFNNTYNHSIKIYVMDIDQRILDYIQCINKQYDLAIKVIYHDISLSPIKELKEHFDMIFSDPPYTLKGLDSFIEHACYYLKSNQASELFLSYGKKDPVTSYKIQHSFHQHHFMIKALHSHFNQYIGAQMINGVSDLYQLLKIKIPRKHTTTNNFYTYTSRIRNYRCTHCHTIISLPLNYKIKTIEQLKISGCPTCGNTVFKSKKGCDRGDS